ncbi:LANO_0C09648g1_1 [Lachancea nothofagi CBS 11611]|uniref:LANO_0C09648g1_1 n=1 Tax=Lachancea nothofagi CBS 11611 TaxID=1266666 RepID=A0A1G4JAI8_9SACH|nr:LANO_0C09648g1_1 [Lachancea nothofagi CBS 11611]
MSSAKSNDALSTVSVAESTNQKLSRNFGWLSLLGISFSLTNSWLGVSSSLVVGLSSGGPLLIVYGLIIGMFFTFMCGWSLAEFSSMLPSSSGACFWVLKMLERRQDAIKPIEDFAQPLSSDNETEEINLQWACTTTNVEITSSFQRSMALVVGLINYFGAIFTTASVFSSLALSILGVHSLLNPDYQLKHWHIFITYEILNVLLTFINCWSVILPLLSQFGLYMSVLTYLITFIISMVCRSNNTDIAWPKSNEVFGEFRNTTGWSSSAMAFIVGLINPLWAYAGIDSATHMVDEVGYKQSRKLVPRAIISTILIGFVTSFTYAIGMFFCITDAEKVTESILPILEIYYQATGNRNLSVFMQCCCILTGITCGIASVTWQSRILWSCGRDFSKLSEERPMSRKVMGFFGMVNPQLKAPLNSHLFSQLLVAVIGCIFMGSSTAFNAIITACITLLLLTYAIPCTILFFVGKASFYSRIRKELASLGVSTKGFPVTSKFGYIPNTLTICWALFCLIFLSFPYNLPVDSASMNYVSVVYGAVGLLVGIIVVL